MVDSNVSVVLVEALRREERELEQQLQSHPAFRKLKKVRALLREYDTDAPQGELAVYGAEKPKIVRKRLKPADDSDPILVRAAEIVADAGGVPLRTAIIYQHLEEEGYQVPGQEPRNTLSARLSNSPMFKSHGRAGWTLADEAKSQETADELQPPAVS